MEWIAIPKILRGFLLGSKDTLLASLHDLHDLFWNGNYLYLAVFIISITVLWVTKEKAGRGKNFLLSFTLITLIGVCYNPLLVGLFSKIPQYSESIYCRLWVILPIWGVISYTVTIKASEIEATGLRNIIYICVSVLLVFSGVSLFQSGYYIDTGSIYKVNTTGIDIANSILSLDDNADLLFFINDSDRADNYIDGGTPLYAIKQYTSDIQVYQVYYDDQTWNDVFLSEFLPDEDKLSKDYINERMVYYRRDYDFDYVVMPSDYSLREKMLYAGYAYRLSVDDYDIYEALPRWRVQSYSCYLENGEKLYLLSDNAGHFVVVGGGSSFNSNAIENVLAFCGYHVDAWILTSPSANTLEGFNSVVKTGNCMVDHVYIPAMDTYFISEYMDECDRNAYEEFLNISETSSFELSFITEGETLEFYGMDFTFLSDLLNVQTGSVTDNSMLIRMEAGEKSFLFCSDMGYEQGQFALQKYGDDLDSDYIQIASGSGMSLGLDFYKTVSPDIAFCDYLEEGDGLETYNMLVSYGIDCYCIENGDRSWIIIE